MQTSRSPQRTSSSTNVAAKAWVGFGSAMGAPVTCLHGFTQHGDSWDEVRALVPGDRRWLAPDVRATTLAEAEADLLALWAREGVERSHLVGYSQGGRVALFVAANHPDRLLSLTTIGAHAGLEGEARSARLAEDRALAGRIEREGVDWFAAHWAGLPLFSGLARRGPAFLARLDAARRRNEAGHLAAQLRGLGAGATEPFWDRLGRITAAALLVAGAEDRRYADLAARLRKAIPNAEVAIVPDAGHAVHLEQPVAFATLLSRHLTRHEESPCPEGGRRGGRNVLRTSE
jgi:2-succinyl-6-hydroxy-2,4-cyclohexadiene-1-carboxylate synthase